MKQINLPNKMYIRIIIALLLCCTTTVAQQRWTISPQGSIEWQVGDNIPHFDHIEMSGEQISCVLRWGVTADGRFVEDRSLAFPMLRMIPNNTHGTLIYRIGVDIPSMLAVNRLTLRNEKVVDIKIDGCIEVASRWSIKSRGNIDASEPQPSLVEITRRIFPSTTLPMLCERYIVRNISNKAIVVNVPSFTQSNITESAKGVEGAYVVHSEIIGSGVFTVAPTDSVVFDAVFQAFRQNEMAHNADVASEYTQRMSFVHRTIGDNLILETPDRVIDTEFRYAKLRASESIFKTKGGYMHSPGGEVFYAAIWANDQAEYVNPFFPFLGYNIGNESAMNSFRHFARFINNDYKPIPSSIIAQGIDIWNGAGDRGDAAMIAYGAARYAMAIGRVDHARQLWPLIEWCLEFCNRKLNKDGVVASDSDELEGRFPAGDANLCTSTLYYDALLSAISLGHDLGVSSMQLNTYRKQAVALATSIEHFFGANIQGYNTYRYYQGNTTLRSWICMPLIVGLKSRAHGTIDALFSPQMWTSDGVLTEQGSTTFWDRSTLYALRGVYLAGYADKATEELLRYSQRRLLGDHVPYPIEAWPEGYQRHLSAESGLYCRIITEGLFGIRPVGLKSFDLTPQMPTRWNVMKLRNISAFDSLFDIYVERLSKGQLKVSVAEQGSIVKTYITQQGKTIANIKLTKSSEK